MGVATYHPKWWSKEQHGIAWERAKAALKRDWEQTKSDFGAKTPDLNQDVDDTVKQAFGKEPVPAPGVATPPSAREMKRDMKKGIKARTWDEVEEPLEYGYSAYIQYGTMFPSWNDTLERTLRTEWNEGHQGRDFDTFKEDIKRGYTTKHL